ncbi:CocE/NonD family hydrolase C-terminal non-catalytic domain-containing protein [Legionella norrlandica]|uniref:CocE/NonD family hydrolase C-terminal non-catalytic domain-containing protein n=1 Tax=Legionella norrlandica TaxID=1498499 RepID=UPI000AF310B8|nr:CocE/NonD family hydrolase C-terminal non-catalytic domain-containing protein [Legionella norrlandica]
MERIEILGSPVVELDVAVDKPNAFIAVRLNEVFPDGSSTRISYGLLNLCHRYGHEISVPVVPNERMSIRIPLKNTAHSFSPGNKLRIALSTTYWPLVWPSSEKVSLTVFEGASRLILPTRLPKEEDNHLSPFDEPENAAPLKLTYIRPSSGTRHITRDLNGLVRYSVVEDSGHYIIEDNGLDIDYVQKETFSIHDDDPLSAKIDIETIIHIGRGEWKTRTEINSSMTSNKAEFQLNATVKAYESDQLVLTKEWADTIPRRSGLNLEQKNQVRKQKVLEDICTPPSKPEETIVCTRASSSQHVQENNLRNHAEALQSPFSFFPLENSHRELLEAQETESFKKIEVMKN